MIRAERVTKRYVDGTTGVEDLSLNINQGEFVAVIGRSGAGKSTLLRQINGMILPTQGKMEVLGVNVGLASIPDLRRLRRQIGFIFQQFNLVKNLTVLQNVLCGRLGYLNPLRATLGLFRETDRERALHYLKEVGLDGRAHSRVDRLSGGQQQRVAIARALVQDPKIILADEPMASLDPKLSEVVLDLLRMFNEKKDITVVVNLHVLDLARRYAKRIVGLREGRLIYDGPPEGLTENVVRQIYD